MLDNSKKNTNFVLLNDVISDAIIEMRYYYTYNFVGRRIDGYEEPYALLTEDAARALKKASDYFISKGYRLKIYDAYRPERSVKQFINWTKDDNNAMKKYFYPNLEKPVLLEKGYIAKKSSHSRGSTVDITLFDMNTGKEVDMGSTFDYFGEISHLDYMGITKEQYQNRMTLKDTMVKNGFNTLDEEWWHFTLKDEPFKDTYFDFPINKNYKNNYIHIGGKHE